jgi:hypothetical protein
VLAKQVLSQLSYTPTEELILILNHFPVFSRVLRKNSMDGIDPSLNFLSLHTLENAALMLAIRQGHRWLRCLLRF